MNNIILIGMPGSGKSTIGIVLAKTLGYTFIDTDILIQNQENRLLQRIIEDEGITRFLNIESRVITSCDYDRCIIATGGSAVLCENTMNYLSNAGMIVFLKLSLNAVTERISNIHTRGIVMEKEQNLKDIYEIRMPLYEEYADIIVDCNNRSFEEVVEYLVKMIKK
ncbi:MAG TPA: shikimate kinase [Spirochaetota bacterium]|nr:shikimate kinase [Spirochaetota bacterium]